ncbi:DNA polymerase III subunit beta [Floridanema aerugineum]|uniref:DNA polymerase III subunit beta n=1 Tax=Floridaenema aerugineum BLCC-F46 TaxID=3153654 RepID=A0ABV4X6F6_9CYAN
MKFSCTAKQFDAALDTVMGAIPSKPNHPILANVLLKASNEKLEIGAFDLSLGITAHLEVSVEIEGSFTIPAKHLSNIISSLPKEEELSFTIQPDKQEATLTCSGKRYNFRGMAASDFPQLPTIEPSTGSSAILTASVLARGLKTTLFATASDETKLVLSGVRLTVSAQRVEFAATNSKSLAVVKDSLHSHGEQPESSNEKKPKSKRKSSSPSPTSLAITVPKAALKELQKLLGNPTETKDDFPVQLLCNDSQIIFSGANFTLVCRALAGSYPDYQQLIPSSWSREVSVSSQQILAAVTRLATFDKHKIIRLVLNPTEQVLSLYVEGKDIGSGAESLPALIKSNDFQIGFDADVLIPAIKAIPSSELCFSFNESHHPATINLPDSTLSSATVLVMPVELGGESPKHQRSRRKLSSQTASTAIEESDTIEDESLSDEAFSPSVRERETTEIEEIETESISTDVVEADLELAALPM